MREARLIAAAFVLGVCGITGCKPTVCGDGLCEFGEGCGSCSTDCGSCSSGLSDAYEGCTRDSDCRNSRDRCLPVSNRGVTRGMCTVVNCANNDDLCDFDMFDARGDCLSFTGSFDCYHRCLSRSDCYPGFGCFTPTGATGAIGNVCLPE